MSDAEGQVDLDSVGSTREAIRGDHPPQSSRPMSVIPPRSLPSGEFRPAATRDVELFGRQVGLCWLPERRNRRGRPLRSRPAIARDHGAEIIANEAVWRGEGVVLTPNRHPFSERAAILWAAEFRREPDLALLVTGSALAGSTNGTFLLNTIGAAASIVRSHGHVLGERRDFLCDLAFEAVASTLLASHQGVELARACEPFPILLLRIRGEATDRLRFALELAALRATAAFNLLDDGTTTWFCPRPVEMPTPHFPQALGAAELWGRWCFDERDDFERADADSLRAALELAGMPRDAGI